MCPGALRECAGIFGAINAMLSGLDNGYIKQIERWYNMIKYDNYKDPKRAATAAADFVKAIKLIATKPDNLDNLESYLTYSFDKWLETWANSPENIAAEMKTFAEMEI